jgi:hypothetical protein
MAVFRLFGPERRHRGGRWADKVTQQQRRKTMARLHRQRLRQELQRLRTRHEESRTMLAILMASIAALFILGIALAYNHAAGTFTASNTSVPTGPRATAPSGLDTLAGRTETTGGTQPAPPARPNARP